MINLMSIEDKEELLRAYKARKHNLYFSVLLSVALMSIVMLLPSIFLFGVKLRIAQDNLEFIRSQPLYKQVDEAISLVNIINQDMDILGGQSDVGHTNVALIDKILNVKSEKISISQFIFENKRSIEVSGKAKDRTSLIEFVRILEKDPNFEQVNSPISNLIDNADIDFRILMVLAER